MTEGQELTVINQGASPDTTAGRIALPPILEGCYTLSIEEAVRQFVLGVPELLERWISRRASPHTQRAYRQDLFTFIGFAGIAWPEQATALFSVKVAQIHAYRDWMLARSDAPKTINRRVSSLSSFYKFLAAKLRLPIIVPVALRSRPDTLHRDPRSRQYLRHAG